MSSVMDGRGSKHQRHLFLLLKEIYHKYSVVYELFIPSLGQRFDLFVMELGLALEYDGEQHFKYIEHFHKDTAGYVASKVLDRTKAEFCTDNGIKMVRLRGDVMNYSTESLKDVIRKVPYPDFDYDVSIFEQRSDRLDKEREHRSQRYQKNKARLLKN